MSTEKLCKETNENNIFVGLYTLCPNKK